MACRPSSLQRFVTTQTTVFSEGESSRPEPLPTPGRVLTVGAHPDDAEFGAGATLAKWALAGAEISMLILTDGSKGSWDPDADPAQLSSLRRAEQEQAAAKLGVHGQLVFGSHIDGELEYSMRLRAEVCLWIRRLKPDVVLGFDPWKRYMLHPDHRAAGWATVDGVVAARDHLFFPEQLADGLEKHRPDHLLLWVPEAADHWEDAASTFGLKIEALLCHSSQTQTTMRDALSSGEHRAQFEARMVSWCKNMGEAAGLELAEAFKMIRP